MDWKFIMYLLVMCSTTIWKLLEILTYGEIQVRQVDDNARGKRLSARSQSRIGLQYCFDRAHQMTIVLVAEAIEDIAVRGFDSHRHSV